jgi:hypothetical protein
MKIPNECITQDTQDEEECLECPEGQVLVKTAVRQLRVAPPCDSLALDYNLNGEVSGYCGVTVTELKTESMSPAKGGTL